MSWAQADLDTIRSNIASGILEIRYEDGRLTRYQNVSEMMAAEKRIASFLARQSVTGPSRRRFAAWSNGA